MRTSPLFVAAAVAFTALSAFAQDNKPAPPPGGPPVRLRATIESFDGSKLMVKAEDGKETTVAVPPNTRVGAVATRTLADIKPNDFIGVTALPGKDGMLHATEVHIFPEAMRGVGEGHYPWDRGPDSSMTNAAVTGMVDSSDGKSVTLSYKDRSGKEGETKIDISPNIPIVTFIPGDPSLLKPGAATVMFARKDPDGTLTALNITAEKDGVKPPM
jgi:hypothetical protein